MKYLDLLGYEVTDRVTGFKGIVESVSYDLYGCIQVAVRPPVEQLPHGGQGKFEDGRWFDAKRLLKHGDAPVMEAPSFDDDALAAHPEIGPAEKPAR